ncbi:MAG: histidine phosphatase family protein [Candidatus Uhrbacteria bacterium]
MKIYLIRHGESVSDVKEKYDGDYDDRLTDKGLDEAKIIAEKLLDNNIQVIFSSSKVRALETSEVLKKILKGEVIISKDLNERDIYGAFQNLSKDYPEEEYRRLGEMVSDQEVGVEGVETFSHFKNRITEGFLKITDNDYQTIAIITHGGPIRCILRDVLKLGEIKKIDNGAIIELEKNNSKFKIIKTEGVDFSRLSSRAKEGSRLVT